jgi:hypothetical protein
MEKFKLKILNPRSSEIRRRFGNSLTSLFNLQRPSSSSSSPKKSHSPPIASLYPCSSESPSTPDFHPLKKRSLFTRLKVKTNSIPKENLLKSFDDLTPVKKLTSQENKSFIFNSCEKLPGRAWLKPREPGSLKTSKRFWSSLEMPCRPVVRERREETPDLWSSYNSTPVGKGNDLETVGDLNDSSFYSVDSGFSSFYSVQSFYSVNAQSLCTTPMRESIDVLMDCDEENKAPKRRIFKAVRK